MYTRRVVVPAESIPAEGVSVTALACWGPSIYLGSESGDVLHFFHPGDVSDDSVTYLFASRQRTHARKTRPVTKILILPSVSRALVLSSSTTSVFSLPEFSPCAGMASVRDVNDLCIDIDDTDVSLSQEGPAPVTVFCKTMVRVVSVHPDTLKLVKNIAYPGVMTGVRRSAVALVANAQSYDMIDLDNVRKIPLFPIRQQEEAMGDEDNDNDDNKDKDEIQPIVVAVGSDEFLVTTGTFPDEAAVGLVINSDGNISRGTVTWPHYPDAVAIDFPYVAAVVGNSILIHSLHDQTLLQTIDYESRPLLAGVSPLVSSFQPMADKIVTVDLQSSDDGTDDERKRALDLAQVSSSLMVYSPLGGVERLLASPRFLYLETELLEGRLGSVLSEMETIDRSSEQGMVVWSYLHLLAAVMSLAMGDYDLSHDLWTDRSDADPRILVYIYCGPSSLSGASDLGPRVPRGIRDVILTKTEQQAVDVASAESLAFFKAFLDRQLQKPESTDRPVLEEAHLRLLLSQPTPADELDDAVERIISIPDLAAELLRQHQRYSALATLYRQTGNQPELLDLWKQLSEGTIADADFTGSPADLLANFAVSSDDQKIVSPLVWWLVDHNPALGLQVLMDSSRKVQFDDKEVIDRLKQQANPEPWKAYLRHVVYDKKSVLYTSDLIAFLLNELLEKAALDSNRVELRLLVQEYQALDVPRRPFAEFLARIEAQTPDRGLAKLRLELLALLDSHEYDLAWARSKLDSFETELALERGVVCHQLGASEWMTIMCHTLGDYSQTVSMCLKTKLAAEEKPALFEQLVGQFLDLPSDRHRQYCIKLVLGQCRPYLDTAKVLQQLPAEWSLSHFADYLELVFRELAQKKAQSMLVRSLSRADNVFTKAQLRALQQ